MTEANNDNTEYFEALNEETLDSLSILDYLLYICGHLLEIDFERLHKANISQSLDLLSEEMELIRTYYEEMEPVPGANTARTTFISVVSIIEKAIEDLRTYMENNDVVSIESGIEMLETADSMIDTIKETIAQQRIELAEISSKIQSGELQEGEPIEPPDKDSVFLTDEDVKSEKNPEEQDKEEHEEKAKLEKVKEMKRKTLD
jgi:hypothetical protein